MYRIQNVNVNTAAVILYKLFSELTKNILIWIFIVIWYEWIWMSGYEILVILHSLNLKKTYISTIALLKLQMIITAKLTEILLVSQEHSAGTVLWTTANFRCYCYFQLSTEWDLFTCMYLEGLLLNGWHFFVSCYKKEISAVWGTVVSVHF